MVWIRHVGYVGDDEDCYQVPTSVTECEACGYRALSRRLKVRHRRETGHNRWRSVERGR